MRAGAFGLNSWDCCIDSKRVGSVRCCRLLPARAIVGEADVGVVVGGEIGEQTLGKWQVAGGAHFDWLVIEYK